jgi:hypothetical protein
VVRQELTAELGVTVSPRAIERPNRMPKPFRDRVPVNTKPRRRLSATQAVHHHRASDIGTEFHCKHPSSLSMPGMDIGKPYQYLYTLALFSGPDHHRFSSTFCDRCLYYQSSREIHPPGA